MKYINLTLHNATKEQKEMGVFDLEGHDREVLTALLEFDDIPTMKELTDRSIAIIKHLDGLELPTKNVMIGGVPYLMPPFEFHLLENGYNPYYAFSKRVSEERVNSDGDVVKVNVFKHLGFVDASSEAVME